MFTNPDIEGFSTAFVIFNLDQKILVIQRTATEKFPSVVGLPGGRVKVQENIIEAAERELLEETGLPAEYIDLGGYAKIYAAENLIMFVWWAYTNHPNKIDKGRWLTYAELKELDREHKVAPNVINAIDSALEKKQESNKIKDLDRIFESLEKANLCLEHSFQMENNKSGWNVYLNQTGVGIIGTSVGLLTMTKLQEGQSNTNVFQAINWLKSIQQADGGWSTRSTQKVAQVSITESTALALRALAFYMPKSDETLQKAKKWLIKNRLANGSWGTNHFSPEGSTYATISAIHGLLEIGEKEACLQSIDWLKAIQNKDGGWGTNSNGSSMTAHTAHAIIALLRFGENIHSDFIQAGTRWLNSAYNDISGWKDDAEVQTIYDSSGDILRIELKHYSAPWAVIALLRSGNSIYSEKILSTLKNILSSQNEDGSWRHPLTPNNKPIWALHDAVFLFTELHKETSKTAFADKLRLIELQDQMLNVTNDIKKIYSLKFQNTLIASKIMGLLNIFLITLLVLLVFGKNLLQLLSLPQIPWAWELAISTLLTVALPILYRFIRMTINEIISQQRKSQNTFWKGKR